MVANVIRKFGIAYHLYVLCLQIIVYLCSNQPQTIMKKVLILFLILLSLPTLQAQNIKKEWRQYNRLAWKDRPRDQIQKLHEIRAIALEQRLPEDFFSTCRKEERIYSRVDWKSRDSLKASLRDVVESYGEPLLTYRWLNRDWDFALAHREELSSGCHPDLQFNRISFLQTKEVDDIANDFEWILWDKLIQDHSLTDTSEVYRLLVEQIGDRYPSRPYLSYVMAGRETDRLAAMKKLAKQYVDDPFRFLPEKEVLQMRFEKLLRDPSVTQGDARSLYNDAEAFSRAIKVGGVQQRVDLSVKHILDRLSKSDLRIEFQNDSVVLIGRNFVRGKLEFLSNGTSRDVSFHNKHGRFYALDTLVVPIPDLPDGSYYVHSDKYYASSNYEKHSLSLAVCQKEDGYAVYVADYQTGEPVSSATLRLDRVKRWKTKNYQEKEIALDGLTLLPAEFQNKIGSKPAVLSARIGDRRSASVILNLDRKKEEVRVTPALMHARVLKERGAYRPGDILKAKAILFEGDLHDRVKALPKGKEVQIRMVNAENKRLSEIDLKTNSFGSVAWEWPIPAQERNGLWNIEVVFRKKTIARSSFRVDDFVLPSYELTFDPLQAPFFPDSLGEITGRLVSYSDHPVEGITLQGKVSEQGKKEWEGPVAIGPEGAFRIPLRLSHAGEYILEIHAVDVTGETRQFEHRFTVYYNLSLSAVLANAEEGAFSLPYSILEKSVLTEQHGHIEWTVKNLTQTVRAPVTYRLTDEQGELVLEGTSEETLDLDLSAFPDGLYFLQGEVDGGKQKSLVDLPILKMTSELNAKVQSVFLPGKTLLEEGESIHARFGAGDGPIWAIASLIAPNGDVLASRQLFLEGTPGKEDALLNVEFLYENSYPDAVRLQIFYFRHAEQIVHEAVYYRSRHEMDLPLMVSRFVDRTMPGAPNTLSLQTEPGVETAVAIFDKSLDEIHPNGWRTVSLLSPVFNNPWPKMKAGTITGENAPLSSRYNRQVSGVVIDTNGESIAFASVSAISTIYTLTDIYGNFSLNVPVGTLLNVECLGYQPLSIPAGSNMRIILEEDVQYLDEVVVGYGVRPGIRLRGIGSRAVNSITSALSGTTSGVQVSASRKKNTAASEVIVEEEEEDVEELELMDHEFREIFSEALAFEPFLYPDESGKVDVSFQTTDKLSTYHVNVFAHDATMRNAALQRDFVVTIPVRIAVTPPRYLYEQDEYEIAVVVSSISDEALSGRLYLRAEAGNDSSSVQFADMELPAGGSASARFSFRAPSGEGPVILLFTFDGGGFQDAVRYSVPVYRSEQLLTECHSALAGPEAVDSLRRMFVNVPGEQAEMTVRTLREVVNEGFSAWTEPQDLDAISLSASLYARSLLGRDTTGILTQLLALRGEDGGFAWTEGMESSPLVTATLLERFARLRDKGIAIPDMEASVHYLDNSQFGNWMPMWCGGLTDDIYMDIRAMWSSVPFDLTGIEKKAVRRYRIKDFRRFARSYLTPGRYDYANGWILDKARRVRTLQNLTATDEGIALGRAWGESVFTASRFKRSIAKDLSSLEQYAVRHPSGGLYYPNAVLPFCGLLSSEVYAHSLLADLLKGPVSDGIKLWLMLQNETQSWTGDPAYLDALQVVKSAPDSLLNRQVVSLTATSALPFKEIRASGNGMRVERRYYLEKDGSRTEIQPGDTLQVGDRIVACYEIWSEENRSFVRINAFREANLLPVNQRSGPVEGKIMNPILIDGIWTRLPQCYRDIRTDRTCWWLDVCPEETTVWEDAFFVTQAGTFTAPVITVESLYAPQYRANGNYQSHLTAEQ